MYHISNYGFADPNYMEHYGVKNMRWDPSKRKRRFGSPDQIRRYMDKAKDGIRSRGVMGNPGSEYGAILARSQQPIRNPQKTNRNSYGASRKAQVGRSNAKSGTRTSSVPMRRELEAIDQGLRTGRGFNPKAYGRREIDWLKKKTDERNLVVNNPELYRRQAGSTRRSRRR